ncbi:MAG: pyridoxal phosphate-dependent aminotransferase family protein [Planctomycetota bacterium]
MNQKLQQFLRSEKKYLQNHGLLRFLKEFSSIDVITAFNGRKCLSFATNNYLGLANSSLLKKASLNAIRKYGTGSGSSRLIAGTLDIHTKLEASAALLKKREKASVFPTGYMANIGAITAVVSEGDAIVSDPSNHASIIDGCRLTKAEIFTYKHCDVNSLEKTLKKINGKYNKILVITESIFSVEGDIAPLDKILNTSKKYNAITMLDDAHATGILGKHGCGGEELFSVEGRFDIIMGAFGKALGSQGGFIAGSRQLIEHLINSSRTFIYTTALSPAAAAAALAAIEALNNQSYRITKLFNNINFLGKLLLNKGLIDTLPQTPIIPVVIGDEKKAVKVQEKLLREGIFVPALRYPTLPKGRAALRISLSSLHTSKDIERLVNTLKKEI